MGGWLPNGCHLVATENPTKPDMKMQYGTAALAEMRVLFFCAFRGWTRCNHIKLKNGLILI